ncbi:hypothetical protein [Fibrella aquatilis]|uniref:Gliding motility-associated C-terminal domain-containing protein n=1 Tax=Fibrella aquatilis TaxID=2817059 RepID=A0A939K3P7_9BACT|nr:hypothetical protein [Fibrella aquatilis]MBO0934570.1 hypothetical protein [Fibrella aquatilis]
MLFRPLHNRLFYLFLQVWLGLGAAVGVFIPQSMQAQAVEICNNGIDDDGDKLVDCQDPDCPECVRFQSCVQPNTCYMPPIWGIPNSTGSLVYGSQDLVLSTSAPFTTVTIRSADGSYTKTVAVTSSGSTIVSLPLSVVMSDQPNTKQTDKGLIITSGDPVQVTYRQTAGNNQDIIPLKCRAALGYAFYAGSQTRLGGNNVASERHFASVMATLDGTVVTFNSPIDLEGRPANVPFSVTLNAGQTYMVTSKVINNGASTENKSMAGTLITSDPDHPIVVNSGSQHTVQPYSGNRDAGMDQLVPARTVGTDYVAVHSLNTTANSDYVFVEAIENNTTVTISGPTTTAGTSSVLSTTVLQAGQVFTYNLPNSAQNRAFYIKTSRKAYAYHVSSYAANEFGMGLLPTINPCNGSKRIEFYRTSGSSNDQAIVTIPSSGTPSLTFRGQPFSVYGTVIDQITINGVPHSIISFPNGSIAAAGNVNTLTSTERFHVGVVSNTGGAATGNYGYYSNYEARVDVINPNTSQPDDFYTVAEVTVGSPVNYCLTLTSCGTTNTIKSIIPGKYTQSATFNNVQCITYTMSTTAPICARDTIRVIVQNELGREGQVCLEYVNKNNDLIVNVIPNNPFICQPTGATSLTIIPTSSVSTFQYQWITPDKQVLTTQVIQATLPGRYLISVQDGKNCIDTTSIVLNPDTPTLKFTGSSAGSLSYCTGTSVPYTLSATAGTYAWSVTNGTIVSGGTPNSQTATVLWGPSAGTGTLKATVTSANGCTATVTQTVTILPAPVLSLSVQNALCFGGSTGRVDLTAGSGTTPYTYKWNQSATTEDLTNVAAGVYSVTVTDRGGCSTVGTTTVGQPTALSLAATVMNVGCNGRTTGAADLTVTGGTAPYGYVWNSTSTVGIATTEDLTGVAAGSYTVVVTDKNGCVSNLPVVINQAPAIALAISGQNVACFGGTTGAVSLTPTGGTGVFTYRWNTGAQTQSLASLPAGTYSVTVTDANNCTATSQVTLQQPPALSLGTTRSNPTCFGSSNGSIDLTVSGGTLSYTYRWTGGATTEDLTGQAAGVYAVTVTDGNSCTALTSLTLTQPTALSLTPTQQNVGCFGGNTGSISLAVSGGTGSYRYLWNGPVGNGSTASNLNGLTAGVYSVTVADANNCTQVQAFTITQATALSVSGVVQNVACNGSNSGGINLTVAGGTAPFRYAWTGPVSSGATTQNLSNLVAGKYTVTVTDANTCVASQSFTVTQPAPIVPNLTGQNITCFGGNTGTANLAPVGGTGTFTYRWAGPTSNNATTQNLTGLTAGTYSVTLTDANNCTATAAILLTQPTAISLSASTQNPGCAGGSNGSIDLTMAGGTPSGSNTYTYVWNTGAQTQSLASLPAGTYSVTVTDGNGCKATASYTLTQPTALSLATTAQNPACFGTATGAISTTATGGTSTYSYRWSGPSGNGAISPTLTNLLAGVYSVTLTDAQSCTLVRSLTLTNPPALSVTTTVQNPACFGANTGSVNSLPTGGTAGLASQPYTYLWSNGATTQNLTSVLAGTYTVTVTDAQGCSRIATATLTNPPALSLAISIQNAACNGAATGSIDLTPTGGTGALSYKWTSGSTTQDLTGIVAGIYSVTVTDANGCTATTQATIQEPSSLTLTPSPRPVSCFGGSNGQIGLTVQGGTAGLASQSYSYLWSNAASSSALSGLSAGIYSVSVTDGNGCRSIVSATVLQPSALSLAAGVTNIACAGGQTGSINTTPSGGIVPYRFSWSDGSTTEDIIGLSSGTYSLTVTDANACSITLSRSLTQPTGIAATASFTNVSCNGGANGRIDLTPSGGVLPYTYLWSTGAVTQDISGLSSNTYVVTITDANGCSFNYAVPIIQPRPLTVQPDPSDVLCNGQTASIVTDTRGGTQPYSYLWSNGATTASVRNLPGEAINGITYSLTVTDGNGCTATTSATIKEPPPFGIAAVVTPVACNAGSTGKIVLNVEGATPPYAFTIKNPANATVSNTSVVSGLSAGVYSATIVDVFNCIQTVAITVQEPPVITLSTALTHISCYGNLDGAISLTATGGRQPFAYAWSDGGTTDNRPGLPAGSFSVVVTDANACTVTTAVSLTQPPLLSLGGSFTNVACFGVTNGQATVTPAGGTLPYTYIWAGPTSNGAITQTVSSLVAGTYSVTVTDGHGCSDEIRFVISQPTALSAQLLTENLTCQGNATGQIDLLPAGGISPYVFNWSNNLTTQNLASLQAGPYSVTIADANGCSLVKSVTLTEPDLLTLTGATVPVACFGRATGQISLTVSGGTGTRAYRWSDGTTSQNRTSLVAGVYSVTVTDANQCAAGQSFTISEPTPLTSTISSQSIACFGSTTGSINLTVAGGTLPYSYTWADGVTSPNRTGLAAGSYLVLITDGNGCQTSNGATLSQPTALQLALTPMPAACFGSSTGGITTSIQGGTPAYSFAWNTGATSQNLTAIPTGTYTLTVTDGNACTVTKQTTVTQPTALSVSGIPTNILCFSGTNGAINLTLAGGTSPYSYTWSNGNGGPGATSQDISSLAAGIYSVTVADANGCSNVQTFTLTQPTAVPVVVSGTNIACFGGTDGTASLTASGGVGPYTYHWNTGDIALTINALPAGAYSVTATDANGCAAQNSLTLTQPAALTGQIAGVDPGCFGGLTGTISTTILDGTGPYSYTWTDAPINTPGRTNLAIGTYTVNVTDANGCRFNLTQTLSQPTPVALSLSTLPARCNGATDGQVSATATGGTPGSGGAYTYVWSTGAQTQTLSAVPTGSYAVTATDGNGCTASATATVGQPSSLSVAGTTENILCFNGLNGKISLEATGGSLPYSYAWSHSASTSATQSGLGAGVYSATVTDGNGCQVFQSFTLTQPPVLTLVTTAQTIACFGGANGAISVSATGGAPAVGSSPYAYGWADGSQTPNRTGLIAGTYAVTATDANQCTTSQSFTLTQPTALSATASSTDAGCFAAANGTISLTVAGGIGPYSYTWADGPTVSDRSSLTAGSYLVSISDANGCKTGLSRTINQPDLLRLSLGSAAVSCFGGNDGSLTAVVTGGTQPYTYAWIVPGVETQNLASLQAGVYSVTVTDAQGCSDVRSETVTQPSALSINALATAATCAGAADGTVSVTATGGTPAYSFVWSNAITTAAQTSLVAGVYSVTGTDGNGCSLATSVTVTEPLRLTVTIATQNNRCEGDRTGRAEATVSGGTGPYSYTWIANGGAVVGTTNVLDNAMAGVYSLITTDSQTCREVTSVTLTEPTRLAALTSLTHVDCFGNSTGAISTTLSGGTPPYAFAWTINGGTPLPATPTQTNLMAGTYLLRINDANNCQVDLTIGIGQPDALSLVESVTPVRCFSGTDGIISLTALGGAAPFQYIWRNANGALVASTSVASGLTAGLYSVTLTDANRCTLLQSYSVSEPTGLTLTGTTTAVNCFAGTDGAVSLTTSGGTQPYSYSWSTGTSTSGITGLSTGVYGVTVTDGNACSVIQSFTVNQPTALSVASLVTAVSCFSGTDGAVSLTATGGTAPYSYSWSTGVFTSALNGLSAGVYSVTLTDANACQRVDSYTISQPTALSLTAVVRPVSCNGGNGGAVSLTVLGGTTPYSYSWSTGASTSVVTGLVAGVYSATVADANGCSLTESFTVNQPTALSLTGETTAVRCYAGTDGGASVLATGGTLPYTYSWSTGASMSAIIDLSSGTYSVTVTDANACSAVLSLTVNQPTALSLLSAQTNVNCAGGADGSISLTVSGGTSATGTAPYTYVWASATTSFSAATQTVAGLKTGAYSVTVTDSNGCLLIDRFVIDQPEPLTVSALPTSVSCTGQPATVTTEVRGGTGPYSYSWSNGTTNATVVSLTAGAYSLTVTDANGCTATTPVSVSQPPPFGINAVVNPVICNGAATGSIDITVEGATPGAPAQPYGYNWTGPMGNGATTQDLSNLPAGIYSLTVTDANNCREVVQFTLTQSAALTLAGVAIAPNCAGPTPRPDGQLVLTTFDPTWRFTISEGSSFTTVINDPVKLPVVPPNGLLVNTLQSPVTAAGQPYTVRIFTVDGCTKDLTLTLLPANCTCKPDICAPFVIRKTR